MCNLIMYGLCGNLSWKVHLKIIYSIPLILRRTNDCLAGINRLSFGQEADQGMVYLATALVNQVRKNCWA